MCPTQTTKTTIKSTKQNPPRYLCHCNTHEPCPTFHLREVEFFFCALPGFQMMVGYTLLRPLIFGGYIWYIIYLWWVTLDVNAGLGLGVV